MFKKILIANRGEIAVRVIRACHELGITAVGVYSEADRTALHVRLADEAYPIGLSPSSESYLRVDRIIEVAKQSKAEAIHPGYGFPAENPAFARDVVSAGLEFIGPPAEVIRLLGDKMAARRAMKGSGVPIVPGTESSIEDEKQVLDFIGESGLPVLVKAAAGGGGKGMRIVHSADEIASAIKTAASEAKSAFGDGRIYIEKYLPDPRHIEIQILCDAHGNYIYFPERECSIQRRHQKVIEESPSPLVDFRMRKAMGEAAIAAAKASKYVNAGTVEFLVDSKRNFYFLEVNTRLQVEHPVTEMVTGYDLVKEQIRIAAGEELGFGQDDIYARGHSLECRIYAEDAINNFMPSVGKLNVYREPSGPGIRVDSGVYEGFTIPIYYDPLISKLIALGRDRVEAIGRMRRALTEYKIIGVESTIGFHQAVLGEGNFLRGNISTHYIEDRIADLIRDEGLHQEERLAAAVALAVDRMEKDSLSALNNSRSQDRANTWKYSFRLGNI